MRDAQHLHSMISNTSDLAEKVSSKVRLLDLVKVGHGHIGYHNYDHNNTGNFDGNIILIFETVVCFLLFLFSN